MINISIFNQQNRTSLKEGNHVFFIDENYSPEDLMLNEKSDIFFRIKAFLKNLKSNKTKQKFYAFDLSENIKICLIKITNIKNSINYENLGADFYIFIEKEKIKNINLYQIPRKFYKNKKDLLEQFVHGINLKSYKFIKYFSNQKNNKVLNIKVFTSNKNNFSKNYKKYSALESGINLTRNLVSEPPNVLTPQAYVSIINNLKKLGLKVTIYDEKKLKSLGMNALLGVGQGSSNKSYLATIEWNGNKNKNKKPLAFVGKGVCFDTGGISLKPAKFMEEMKYDMAGSAVVVGLLKTLALRKAKVNVVGVVGLVENMPGGNAQRPGDIVKSYSGKTIEILNTDAEGRLVLADALTFTEKKFKPKFIIDLATLTGAIIVSLGEEYAGLFSNDDSLSNNIFKVGNDTEEKVWRLPLHKNYNKLMDSTIADVQNINYSGGAGSITAAEFLQRFILNNTPWAHLDIAGMAFSKKAANLNPKGATGFGVRLLNKLIEENYE
jgi:leucyl aminopeptidase